MNILFINNGSGIRKGLSGGTERLLQLCASLHRKRHTLHIITAAGDKDFFDELGLRENYTINPNPLSRFDDNKLTRSMWYVFSMFSTLRYYARARAAQLIYAPSDYICDVIPAIILSRLAKRPLVGFIHHECRPPSQRKGLYIINLLSYVSQSVTFWLLRQCASMLFFYDTQEGKNIARYFPKLPVAFLQNGIDPAFAQPHTPITPKHALFAGGLRPSKGIDALIDVWAMVVKQQPNAVLRVAGGGDAAYTHHVRTRIAEHKLDQNLLLLGALDKKNIMQEYQNASLYISCSHEEGWGISVYQALAAQQEVFAFDLPCFARIAPYCHLYSPASSATMADAIVAFLHGVGTSKALTFPAKDYYWETVLELDHQQLEKVTYEYAHTA